MIYADSASDQARAVYADRLLERGVLRDDLLSLQLAVVETPDQIDRERGLLQTYARAWRPRLA